MRLFAVGIWEGTIEGSRVSTPEICVHEFNEGDSSIIKWFLNSTALP